MQNNGHSHPADHSSGPLLEGRAAPAAAGVRDATCALTCRVSAAAIRDFPMVWARARGAIFLKIMTALMHGPWHGVMPSEHRIQRILPFRAVKSEKMGRRRALDPASEYVRTPSCDLEPSGDIPGGLLRRRRWSPDPSVIYPFLVPALRALTVQIWSPIKIIDYVGIY
eukprot:SAG31_NODE_2308_length_5966_cov_3.586330_2_plen_168_part_00